MVKTTNNRAVSREDGMDRRRTQRSGQFHRSGSGKRGKGEIRNGEGTWRTVSRRFEAFEKERTDKDIWRLLPQGCEQGTDSGVIAFKGKDFACSVYSSSVHMGILEVKSIWGRKLNSAWYGLAAMAGLSRWGGGWGD
jgi:hypothetical protein